MKQLGVILTVWLVLSAGVSAQQGLWMWLEQRYGTEEWDNEELEAWLLETDSINLNTVTRAQLEALPFLHLAEVESLLEYRFDYGPLLSVYELYYLPAWSEQSAGLLSEIAWAGPKADDEHHWKTAKFKIGKHQIKQTLSGCMQAKRGMLDGSYSGWPVGGNLKYTYTHPLLEFRLTMEHDAFEPLLFKQGTGFDFVSGNVVIRELGCVKQLLLGDFKADFGQGLLLKPNSMFCQLRSANQVVNQCKAYGSTTEYGFLRGGAVTCQWKKVECCLLGSYFKTDKTGGLHRTQSELNRRYKNTEALAGIHWQYQPGRLQLGLTALQQFKREAKDSVWNQTLQFSQDYRYVGRVWVLAGETACDLSGKWSAIHRFWMQPTGAVEFDCSLRYKNKEEIGCEHQLMWYVTRQLKSSFKMDAYSIDPAKSGKNRRMFGYDSSVLLHYSPLQGQLSSCEYRFGKKEKSSESTELKHQLKLVYQYGNRQKSPVSLAHEYVLKTGFNLVWYRLANWKKGSLAYMDVTYKRNFSRRMQLGLNLNLALFDSENYDSRLYLYTRDAGATSRQTMLYGLGVFQSAAIDFQIKQWKIGLGINHVRYLDRNSISSGSETISGSRKTNWKLSVNKSF